MVACLCLCFSLQSAAILIIGHRGARRLAPENTIPSYQIAIDHKVDYVDVDIVMTRDGILVAYHDLFLNPDITKDELKRWIDPSKRILVKNLALKQLKRYDVGQINPNSNYAKLFPTQKNIPNTPIPTLKEVIHFIKAHAPKTMKLEIEIKSDPLYPNQNMPTRLFLKTLVQLLTEEQMISRVKVQAFDWKYLRQLQQMNPAISTAYLTDEDISHAMHHSNPKIAGQWSDGKLLKNYHNSLPYMIKTLGGQWWDAQDTELTPKKVRQAHQLGLLVSVWTWPERSNTQMNPAQIRAFEKMNIDAIITDAP